tara:strand:- start:1255 stop:1674 length:420 start_codon:yes stop_codon:yes gene_type:complete
MRLVLVILALSPVFGCGKKRILREANHIQGLAAESLVLAEDIVVHSSDPEVVSMASQIAGKQEQIIGRAINVSLATTDVEDRAEGYSAWWGDFFIGSIENVKWVVIATIIAVVAFVGTRAKLWSFLGSLLRPSKSGASS